MTLAIALVDLVHGNDAGDLWRHAIPLRADGLAAGMVASRAGVPFGSMPALPGLGEHAGIVAPELGRECPAILGALATPDGAIVAVAAWLLDRAALAVPRCIGLAHGAAVPVTQPGRAADTALLVVGLSAALQHAARCGRAQVWMVPTAAHLATVALPARLRCVDVVPPDGDPSFADEVFVEHAVQRLAAEGHQVRVVAVQPRR
jgi:hypothetical protein